MRKIVLLGLYIICFKIAIAQKNDITGIYYNESGYCLQLRSDSIKLLIPQVSPVTRSSDLWFEGKYQRINENFIEINSINNPWKEVQKTIEITQEKKSDKNNIEIKFLIPYGKSDLKITIYTNNDFNFYEFIYSENNQNIILPKTGKFSFYIVPEHLIPHTPIGTFYGIIAFDSMVDYAIDNGMNYIEIRIPAMNDSFFETYYIEGDYARIVGDNIIWKGEIYRKIK
jgi:hypothetical protein